MLNSQLPTLMKGQKAFSSHYNSWTKRASKKKLFWRQFFSFFQNHSNDMAPYNMTCCVNWCTKWVFRFQNVVDFVKSGQSCSKSDVIINKWISGLYSESMSYRICANSPSINAISFVNEQLTHKNFYDMHFKCSHFAL